MKTTLKIAILLVLMTGCVQKSYKRVIVVTLDTSTTDKIQSVGLRGNGNPLSWETDYPMQEVIKGVLYKTIITTNTGYLYAEAKFTVNGTFELQNEPNRRIVFNTESDTTTVHFVFDRK